METTCLVNWVLDKVVKNLVFLLAKRIGQKVDIQRLSQELGIARQTVYDYLDFLFGTYFISLVSALGQADVAVRKQRKVYFIDTGFFSFLEKPPFGSIFENAVYANLRLWGELFYFQKNQQEIDFVLKTPKRGKMAFEAKETATSSDVKRMKRRAGKLGLEKSFVISYNFSGEKEAKYLFQLASLKSKR